MTTIFISIIFLLQSVLNHVHCITSDSPESTGITDCSRFNSSCATCLQAFDCVWCADPTHEDPKSPSHSTFQRCQSREAMKTAGCDDHVHNFTSEMNIIEKEKTSKDRLISPQKINFDLRANDPVTFTMEYQDPGDKPLDLYYLMDLSHTMVQYKNIVADQAQNLANALEKLTGNLTLGFGSFIDKPIVPFASKLQLDGRHPGGVIPYSFKNHLKLQANVPKFKDVVSSTNASANFDNPEGTLDALMQVMACKEEIGWRSNARRLIVVSTDGPFHIAGDGRLLGILTPNDMECHMEKNSYTHYDKLDYPSIAQINKKAKDKDSSVYIVFAVTKSQLPLYEQLAKRIQSASAVLLTNESRNVVDIVSKEYQKIKSTLQIRQEPKKIDGLQITYTFNCENQIRQNDNGTADCRITAEAKQEFSITVKLTDCNKFNKQSHRSVKIYSPADAGQMLQLNIQSKCNCDCEGKVQGGLHSQAEAEDEYMPGSVTEEPPSRPDVCHKRGEMECGQCKCDDGFTGRNCECDQNDHKDIKTKECIRNGTDTPCSEKGDCRCGECVCHNYVPGVKYWGTYCEKGNQDCLNDGLEGAVCSDKGICRENECKCNAGYEGKLCQCSLDESPCIEPGHDASKKCNGRARCECPKVLANRTSPVPRQCHDCADGYEGQYCHISIGSRSGTECTDPKIKGCVNCIVENNGIIPPNSNIPTACNDICVGAKTNRSVTFIVEVVQQYRIPSEYANCDRKLQDGCTIRYMYQYEGASIKVQLLQRQESDCPTTPWWIIYVVVGSIVLIGILTLLIWKVATHIHDKREYERFQESCKDGTWAKGENPLYVKTSTTVHNPTFQGGRS